MSGDNSGKVIRETRRTTKAADGWCLGVGEQGGGGVRGGEKTHPVRPLAIIANGVAGWRLRGERVPE